MSDRSALIKKRYGEITEKVASLSGCDKFLLLPDGGVAFAGTLKAPLLVLRIEASRDGCRFNLTIEGEDEETSCDGDFDSPGCCSDAVAKRIASLMGKTVRFIRKQRRHSFVRFTELALDGDGGWETITDYCVEDGLTRLFLLRNRDDEKTVTFPLPKP